MPARTLTPPISPLTANSPNLSVVNEPAGMLVAPVPIFSDTTSVSGLRAAPLVPRVRRLAKSKLSELGLLPMETFSAGVKLAKGE